MLREEDFVGGLNFKVPAIEEVCAQDWVTELYLELRAQKKLDAEYQSVHEVAAWYGY